MSRTQWVLVAVLLVAFAALAVRAHQEAALALDVRFTRWVQAHDSSLLEWLTTVTNWLMNTLPLTVAGVAIALLLLTRGHRLDAAVLALATAIRTANSGLKEIVGSPRPTSDLVHVDHHANGLGYPSGHAASALFVVGALAWVASRHVESRVGRIGIWLVALFWIVLTGIGRIRIGVHWPTDVLGAWLWAAAALLVITAVAGEQARRRAGEQLDQGAGQ